VADGGAARVGSVRAEGDAQSGRLAAPFGPTKPVTWPGWTVHVTPSVTGVEPNPAARFDKQRGRRGDDHSVDGSRRQSRHLLG
jgi:hypothetical protein